MTATNHDTINASDRTVDVYCILLIKVNTFALKLGQHDLINQNVYNYETFVKKPVDSI